MIKRAAIEDLDLVAPLFDQYRQFYHQSSALKSAKDFLQQRLIHQQSVIFLALDDARPAGFTQLYPTFSSISLQESWLLNDLYVNPEMRGRGVGEALLRVAIAFAISKGAKALSLETAPDNPARKLYEKLGWKQDTFLHYSLLLQ